MGLSVRHLLAPAGAGFAACITLAGFAAPSLASGGRRAGHRTSAVSAAELATAVKQATGLEPSQLTSKRVCGNAKAGQASCDAEVLVSRSSGAAVHPKVMREHLLAQSKAAATRASASTSTSEPIAGSPGWIQEAYDLTWLSENKGAGTVIAVVDAYDDPDALSDMIKFRETYGLPACNGSSANTTASNYSNCFKRVSQTGSTSTYPLSPASDSSQSSANQSDISGWVTEESLDLDAISTTCPLCTIDLVEANSDANSDLNTAVAEAHTLGAKIISLSWGGNDPYSDYTDGSETDTFLGTTTLAASGDDGTEGVGSSNSRHGDQQFPAALPGVTAVGGTSLAGATGVARGFSESVWDDNSGATGSGCATDVPTPSWQSSSTTGCSGRAYNDVSADADPATGLDIYDSFDSSSAELVGGTSLATPLLAGYEAVTGLGLSSSTSAANSDGSLSGEWAYADIGGLNDITSGNNGTCTISLICNAQTGWDGPSGSGSISGDLVSGGPGIGAAYVTSATSSTSGSDASNITATGATLTTGIYPNGLDTSVSWQYGTTSSFGETTASSEAGSGTDAQTVTGTLTGLAPNTTYYYRAVAENSDGTTYGYTYSFTTTGGSATTTTSTTSTTGSGTAAAPAVVTAAKLTGTAKVGSRVYVTGGTFKNVTSKRVVLKRCLASCVTIAGAGSGYKLAKADTGAYIRAYEVLAGKGGTRTVAVTGLVGPVRSTTTTSSAVKVGTVTVKVGSSTLRVRGTVVGGKLSLRLTVTRGRARTLRAWVYSVAGNTPLRRVSASNLNGVLRLLRTSGIRFVLVLSKV